MQIRIFAAPNDEMAKGLDKFMNFLRLQEKGDPTWNIEHCDPMKWAPCQGDLHIYIDVPVRVAVPWASYNVYASDFVLDMWAWATTEMDLVISRQALSERSAVLNTLRNIVRSAAKSKRKQMLPSEPAAGFVLPKVGIVTVTRNRKEWWANMMQNVVNQKWPLPRLEWIIVDDGDEDQRLKADVDTFVEKTPGLTVRYLEMEKPRSIGAKRNAAVEAAAEDVSVFVMMDDDDHYPPTSIAKRVSWLYRTLPAKKPQSQIVYSSVLPMYDLTRYISAINVPPLDVGPAERVSEATLAFTREAWVSRQFPDVSMAEGLGFIEDREELTVEIPHKDVIVSFIHLKNSSSRRIPADQEPNGCHYGFSNEYFTYLHKVGGGKTS